MLTTKKRLLEIIQEEVKQHMLAEVNPRSEISPKEMARYRRRTQAKKDFPETEADFQAGSASVTTVPGEEGAGAYEAAEFYSVDASYIQMAAELAADILRVGRGMTSLYTAPVDAAIAVAELDHPVTKLLEKLLNAKPGSINVAGRASQYGNMLQKRVHRGLINMLKERSQKTNPNYKEENKPETLLKRLKYFEKFLEKNPETGNIGVVGAGADYDYVPFGGKAPKFNADIARLIRDNYIDIVKRLQRYNLATDPKRKNQKVKNVASK